MSGYFAAHAPLTCSGGRTMTIMGLPIGVLQLGAWDRQTDRQTGRLQHRLLLSFVGQEHNKLRSTGLQDGTKTGSDVDENGVDALTG